VPEDGGALRRLPVPEAALDSLDAALQRAARSGDHAGLSVLGYGEVTTVVRLQHAGRDYAVKGLPTFRDQAAAERHVAAVERYVRALTELGVRVVATDARLRAQPGGSHVVYLLQPMFEPDTMGQRYVAACAPGARLEAFGQVVETLRRAVTAGVTPDGQLSNWAFTADGPVYLDVSTPFLRDAEGRPALDWTFFVDAHPWPLRPLIRAQLPAAVGKYHSLRTQLVDLLGNLLKEDLAALLPALTAEANRRCGFERPITEAEVRRYYAADARTFGALLEARRLDRFVRVRLLGRTYPVLVPPRFERHPGGRRPVASR
jgi:hypothetical protein